MRPLSAVLVTLLVALALSATAHADTACLPGARCGTVTVPLDRQNPGTGTIDVAYALVPHTDTSRPSAGTIVPNPGGPAQATIASAPSLYLPAMAPLMRERDLLLIDPRGTGQSGALTCSGLSGRDPFSVDMLRVATLCGPELGARAGLYGSAAVTDDIDAVRAALGIDKLDLWGDSYGTFLMPVYAARHPDHVRSIVLDGAFPIASDPWGRDVLGATRRVIGLVCRRTHRCSGPRVLARLARLAQRLRRHPVRFTASTPKGPVRLTIGERELASVTHGGGDPRVFAFLPAAVDAALRGDYAPLKRLVTVSRIGEAEQFVIDPSLFSITAAAATSCHDYPRPYDLAAPPAQRHAQYRRALAALDARQFEPFSPAAWLGTGIDAGPKCLDWPADPTAGSPVRGLAFPDVPVLVQSGDLDDNTPIEQGRVAAAQFPHAIIGIVSNAGHTPDLQPCGVAMAIDFVERLTTDTGRCLHVGHAPVVQRRPAGRAAQLRAPRVHAPASVRRAIAVALATIADERTYATYADTDGTLDALRGGTYVVAADRVRFATARVVTDATADGTQTTTGAVTRTSLRLRGRGVRSSRLTLEAGGRTIHVTGTVGGRRVAVTVP